MSIENAILEHAGALREMAAAINALVGARAGLALQLLANDQQANAADEIGTTKPAVLSSNDKEKAIQATYDAAEKKQKDAELEQAAQKVEDDAKAEEVKAEAGKTDQTDTPVLDYVKDVRPVLLAAIKKAGKDTVAAMLKEFGVDKADKLTAEQLPAALAEAQKLVA